MNELNSDENYNNQTYKDIKYIEENGIEFGYARKFMKWMAKFWKDNWKSKNILWE